ncbi:MAG TPA: YihY/virulence factor BrkB family protein [Candidatus Dormibacteraeota bacterium]|nr:YihY/virulence factor BrkB family protein [Candidatus Dormibacteraeota bacterium]
MKRRLHGIIQRAQGTMPAHVLIAYGRSRASNYALALAFAGFMSMFPMMLGALAIIGFAIRDPATDAHFASLVLQVFPASAQPELEKAMNGVKQSAGWLGLVSLGGLLWSASSIFATMEFALTQIFGTRQRDMLRQRLMGLVMMLVLVAAIVVIVGINAVAAFLPLASWITWSIGFVAGAAVMIALLCALYRFVPNRKFRLRDVLPGAVLAGVLIELLALVFPLYAKFAGSFNTYGAQFALFFLLATWFYFVSQLVLLGAVYNRFRLGEPAKLGTAASPMRESLDTGRPVEAIKAMQAERTAPDPARRSIFQRAGLGVVVAAAFAAGIVRRKRRRAAN